MAPALFISRRLTDPGEYTKQIEGPAVDAAGTLFVMNLKVDNRGTGGVIGKLSPGTTKSVQFAKLPNGGIGSGARFDRAGRMYVADFKQHKLHVFDPGKTTPGTYFEPKEFRAIRQVRPAERSRHRGRRHHLRQRSEALEGHRPHLANYPRCGRQGAWRGDDLRQRAHGRDQRHRAQP